MKRGLSAAEQQALATGRYSQLDAKDEDVTEVLPSKVPDEAAAVVDTHKQEQTKQRAKRDALATGEDKARFEKDVAQSVFFERGEHAEKVNEVAFSRDGTTLVTASDDRTVMLRDVLSREVKRTLMPSNSEKVTRVACSANDRTAVALESGTIMISSKLEDELLYDEDEDDDDDGAPERSAPEWVGKFACESSREHGPAIAFSTNGDTLAVMGGLADGSSGTFAQSGKITLLDTAEAADGKLDVEPGPMVLGVGNAEFVAAAFADGVVESATEFKELRDLRRWQSAGLLSALL